MKKKRILPVLLALFLAFFGCGVREEPASSSVPPAFSSAAPSSSSGLASPAPAGLRGEGTSNSLPASSLAPDSSGAESDRPASSALSPASRISSSSRPSMTLNSSLPPAASPQPAAKPMTPVTAKMPQASGSGVFSRLSCTVDFSNSSEGYIMVKYSGSSKIKVLVYFNGGSSYYQYNITGNGSFVTLPLQSGSGSYRVRFMENVSGSSYAELCSTELSASVTGSGYTLYPNQYADYTLSSAAVAKAKSLCAGAPDNARKVDLIYRYVISNIKYDYPKASSVQSGYLPNVDSTLSTKKGICFDYAALMAAMCRSQGIPTKLVIGDTSVGYHAWNEIYVGGWKRYDATFAAAGQTAGTYTPQKYY